jgi:hypothetical protein
MIFIFQQPYNLFISQPYNLFIKKNAYFFVLYLIKYLHYTNDAHGQRFCSKG